MAGRKIMVATAGMVVLSLAFLAGYASYPLIHVVRLPAAEQTSTEDAMAAFWQVWHLLARDFYGEKPDERERTYGAIAGMVQPMMQQARN